MKKLRFTLPAALRLTPRQLLILAALAAPIAALEWLSYRNEHGAKAPPPPVNSMQGDKAQPAVNDFAFLSLDYIRTWNHEMLKVAETMTPQQYTNLRRTNPHLPRTLEGYRERLQTRITQLEAMSEEDWNREMARNSPPMPRGNAAAMALPEEREAPMQGEPARH